MNIKIEINTDGEAFNILEMHEILWRVADNIVKTDAPKLWLTKKTEYPVSQENGNRCGTVTITESASLADHVMADTQNMRLDDEGHETTITESEE